MIFYAVVAAGGVYSAASAASTPSELARQIKDGPSELVVCSKDVEGVAVEAAKNCEVGVERVLVLRDREDGMKMRVQGVNGKSVFKGEEQGGELVWEKVTNEKILEERPVCILYSSGTTGVPKGELPTLFLAILLLVCLQAYCLIITI